ncbi:hypothetical protein [Deinococcus marmoris]|uniref:phage NrS-1 polymerase family protein n=1 Tax=Deinococcus marmoris TaxID=249408 RepID=UPI000496ED2C|nr:hypothetical protein [Deinococcus marmoris]
MTTPHQDAVACLLAGWPLTHHGQRRYLGYQLVQRTSGRLGKVPVRVSGGRTYPVDPLAGHHHLLFSEALELLTAGHVDGVGIALSEADPKSLVAVDLDDVVMDGQITDEARAIVDQLDSYTEISCSGRGLHIVAAGSLPAGRRRGNGVELISSGFLALTGTRLVSTRLAVMSRGAELVALQARLVAPASWVPRDRAQSQPLPLNDRDVVYSLRRGRVASQFSSLFDHGDLSAYAGDHSRADLALLRLLSGHTRDPAQLQRLWAASALYRPERWRRRATHDGRTYAEATLDLILST